MVVKALPPKIRKPPVNSLMNAERQRWSRPADARCHLAVRIFADLDLAARTGDGDKRYSRRTDEFAPGVARWRSEPMQGRRPGRAGRPKRTRRACRTDASGRTGWTRWTSGSGKTLALRSGWTWWSHWTRRPLLSLRPFKACGQRQARDQCDNGNG
jgi:hypothetical protein